MIQTAVLNAQPDERDAALQAETDPDIAKTLTADDTVKLIVPMAERECFDTVSISPFVGETAQPTYSVDLNVINDIRSADDFKCTGSNRTRDKVVLFLGTAELRWPGSYFGWLTLKNGSTQVVRRLLVKLNRPEPELVGVGQDGVLGVPISGFASLRLRTQIPGTHEAKVTLSPFNGREAEAKTVLLTDGDGQGQTLTLSGLNTLKIDARQLAVNQVYQGELSIGVDGRTISRLPVKLKRLPRDQTAVPVLTKINPDTIELNNCLFWFWSKLGCKPGPIYVKLSEKTRGLPLNDIWVTVQNTSSPKGTVDLVSRLKVDLSQPADGSGRETWTRLSRHAAFSGVENIPAGQDRTIRIQFPPLGPGEHKIKLLVEAANGGIEDVSQVELTTIVKLSPIYAIFILLVTIAIFVFAAKLVQGLRARAELRSKIWRLEESSWLRKDKSGILPIVQVAASLKRISYALIQEPTLHKLVSIPIFYTTEVKTVEKREPLLRRLSQLEDYWFRGDGKSYHRIIVYRAQQKFRELVRDIGDGPRDQDLHEAFKSRIAELEQWSTDGAALEHGHKLELAKRVERLKPKVRIEDFTGADESRAFLTAYFETAIKDLQKLNSLYDEAIQIVRKARAAPNPKDLSAEDFMGFSNTIDEGFLRLDHSWVNDLEGELRKCLEGIDNVQEAEATFLSVVAKNTDYKEIASNTKAIGKALNAAQSLSGNDPIAVDLIKSLSSRIAEIADLKASFQDTLQKKTEDLKENFQAVKESDREFIKSLLHQMDEEKAPGLSVVLRDEAYCKLKLLWSENRRYQNETNTERKAVFRQRFEELLELARENRGLETIFLNVNRWVWLDLVGRKDELTIKRGVANQEFPKAYQLFDLNVIDPYSSEESYLFSRGLNYQWSIKYRPKVKWEAETGGSSHIGKSLYRWAVSTFHWLANSRTRGKWQHIEPKTSEPRVNIFIPVDCGPDDIEISVTISPPAEIRSAGDQDIEIHANVISPKEREEAGNENKRDLVLSITKQTQFGILRSFQTTEVLVMLVSILAAVGAAFGGDEAQEFLTTGSLSSIIHLVIIGVAAKLLTDVQKFTDAVLGKNSG